MAQHRTPLTLALMSGCVLASLPLLLFPSLREKLGTGASPLTLAILTSPLVHGFSRASVVPHLAGNLALLWYTGSRVETVLGTLRLALLTLGALVAYVAIQVVRDFEVNGASVFIWAYAPCLALLYRSSRRTDRNAPSIDTDATPIVLAVMWVAVPLFMTMIPYAFSWSGSLIGAFLVANTFHISATIVGFWFAWAWRERLTSNVGAGK